MLKRYGEGRAINLANLDANTDIDWMQCELIETVPGKVLLNENLDHRLRNNLGKHEVTAS